MKVKTRVKSGESPGRLASNHNTQGLKVKTRVRSGESPGRLASNHNETAL